MAILQLKAPDGSWFNVGRVNDDETVQIRIAPDTRIKPEKKPDVVKYVYLHTVAGSECVKNYTWDIPVESANCKLTFSSETGELIKAEVLK